MNMTVMMHDNHIYGLTKMQASPTTPLGIKSNTSPRGAYLQPLNPLTATLGISNVSFVAQAVDWIPELLYDILHKAYHHRGFSFITILQRCPNYLPTLFDPQVQSPERSLLLTHENGLQISPELSRVYKNQEQHDPRDLHRAREIASMVDVTPVGILYHNPDVPCYEDIRQPMVTTPEMIRAGLEEELDRFTVTPGTRAGGKVQ